ncbi:hypothetical protein FP2_27580 [Faecalibacterium prausnitzii L2-6]|uniref:Uncharacterized protein n=1 Tax=Faecalibacterium prausnitzii L2-6 TaxID=718252 RepID=D4K195_9FIRM|nr:hypothetical protein FP2_27580 [Faecalibacterium prausnitzii L2-6]
MKEIVLIIFFHHSFFLKVERKHGGNALVADMNGMQLLQAE